MSRKTQSGISLVSMTLSLSVSALLVSQAMPAMSGLHERQRLRASADQLRSDLVELRQLAVTRQRSFRLHVGSACYIIHDGDPGACHCDVALHEVSCAGSAQVHKVQWPAAHLASSAGRDLSFSAGTATATPTATLSLTGRDGEELRQIIAITGRVRTCRVGTATGDLPAC